MSRAGPASHGQGQKRERRPNEKGYRERGTHLRTQAILVDEGERRPPIAAAVPIIHNETPPATRIRSCKITLEHIEPMITAATTRLPNNTQRYSSGTNERSPTPPNVPSRRPRSTYARPGTSMARLSLVAMAARERHHEQVHRAGRPREEVASTPAPPGREQSQPPPYHDSEHHRDEQEAELHLLYPRYSDAPSSPTGTARVDSVRIRSVRSHVRISVR